MPKIFVLDTNVLLHDPNCLMNFADNTVVLSITAIEELDKLKSNPAIGHFAREVSRRLTELRKVSTGSCTAGMKTPSGGVVRIDVNGDDVSPLTNIGLTANNDNKIILVCRRLASENKGVPVVLVTKDNNMRFKAETLGVAVEDYRSDRVDNVESIVQSETILSVSPDVHRIINQAGHIDASKLMLDSQVMDELLPNCCCQLVNTANPESLVLAIYDKEGARFELVKKPGKFSTKGLAPKNVGQAFAFTLCTNERIPLVTLGGKAGTGKSLMALLAGFKLLDEKKFQRVIVFRPTDEVGKSLGFLPGTVEEKFGPWQKPVIRLAEKILGQKKVMDHLEAGRLQIIPINYERGGTHDNSFIILDETQNLTPVGVKTIITRAGSGTKMILTGDIGQIDTPYLTAETCGFAHVVSRWKGKKLHGHCLLTQGERSELAEMAANLL